MTTDQPDLQLACRLGLFELLSFPERVRVLGPNLRSCDVIIQQ